MPKGLQGFQKGHKINIGRKFSEEVKEKMKHSHKKDCMCPVCEAKRGNAKKGEDHPMHGRQHSLESRKKMSKKLLENPTRYWLGKRRSKETRIKISAIQQGVSLKEWNGFLSPEEISKRARENKKGDATYQLNHNISTAICNALKGRKHGSKWQTLVGYTLEDLKEHLESKFDKNINWDNYGTYWEVDHIIPKSWFIYKKPEDIGFKMCWDLDNLQPLEKTINRHKHNSFVLIRPC